MKTTTLDLKQDVHLLCTPQRAVLLMRLIDLVDDRLSVAPASSSLRYHHAYPGGLVDHIAEVAYETVSMRPPAHPEAAWGQSAITVALLHDLNKIGDSAGTVAYGPNILKSGKVSEAIPYEKDKSCRKLKTGNPEADALLEFSDPSDGEASLALLAFLMPDLLTDLTESEVNAIRYHDGGYGKAKYAAGYQGKEDRLAIIIHAADMLSSRARNWETPISPTA